MSHSAISDLQNVTSGNAIVFRLYAWGASGLNGTFAIGRLTGDDLVFKGNVDLVTHTLTYTAGSNGSVAGTSPQTINHNSNGTEVTAVADSNYHFTTWSDGSTANARTDTNIVSDISAAANFAINTHTLTYTAGSNGSVAGTSPQTINHNSNGTEVTAVADSNYHFTTWSDGSTANPRTDTNIVSDISAAANFEINNTGGGGGGGSSCCGGRVDTTPALAPAPAPIVVPPPVTVQPEIQPVPKLEVTPAPLPIVANIVPRIIRNTAPAKIISEVSSVAQNQTPAPEQITAAEPTVPLETR